MQQNYPVVHKTYQFTLWVLQRTEKLPRNHRYTLGEKLQKELMELLLELSDTIYAREKRSLLEAASRRLERIRLLLRLLHDLKLLGAEHHRYAADQMEEIGKQIGGWMKHV